MQGPDEPVPSWGTDLSPGQETTAGGNAAPALPGHLTSQEKSQSWIFRFITWFLHGSNSHNILDNRVQLNRKWLQIRRRLRELVCKLRVCMRTKGGTRPHGAFTLHPLPAIIFAVLWGRQNHALPALRPRGAQTARQGGLRATLASWGIFTCEMRGWFSPGQHWEGHNLEWLEYTCP